MGDRDLVFGRASRPHSSSMKDFKVAISGYHDGDWVLFRNLFFYWQNAIVTHYPKLPHSLLALERNKFEVDSQAEL